MTNKITTPKFLVFVLMPFTQEFDDIYELGIKAACAEAGAYAERVDEQIFPSSIRERIYNQIAKADLIVADMTGKNPNVFYEVGYAHALGKKVILLTQNSKDIPFDLNDFQHIIYENKIMNLKRELCKYVRWYIENPNTSPACRNMIDLYIGETKIDSISCPEIKIRTKYQTFPGPF